MVNDGAYPVGADVGSGLTGLRERAVTLDGSVTGEHAGQDRFLLRAALPLPERVSRSQPPLPAEEAKRVESVA
jgi:two-component system sensor histidine kinase DesK